MQTGIHIPNSLCWSVDGSVMYFADSPMRTIFAYPFDAATGELGERRIQAGLLIERQMRCEVRSPLLL